MENQLKSHVSPYLAMHGNDPVLWQDWNADTLALAKKTGKPLFVSSGYFSCHWCHVMQRESYSDPEVAAVINQYFIPVKVDRELEPALDEYLISFVQATRGSAGWPLNVFVTPEGYPLVGLTYLPRNQFLTLLSKLAKGWQKDPDALNKIALGAAAELKQQQQQKTTRALSKKELSDAFLAQLKTSADEFQGGFGNQTKFPMTPQIMAALQFLQHQDNAWLKEFLVTTLDHMANRGMRDQLAGGFFRYSTDPDWMVPHYEKMLYSQALIAQMYFKAANVLNKPEYRQVATSTLDFVLNVFKGKQGGYISSSSAVDQSGEEGGNYLWTKQQLTELLSEDELKLAQAYWGLLQGSGEDAGFLPRINESVAELAKQHKVSVIDMDKQLDQLKLKLLQQRGKRPLPLDTKQLAAWNGLLLTALVEGVKQTGRDDYKQAANALYRYLQSNHIDGTNISRLARFQGDVGTAAISDYAYIVQALVDWQQLNKQQNEQPVQLLKTAFQRYASDNGWVDGGASLLPLVAEHAVLDDGALPSASAYLIDLAKQLNVRNKQTQVATGWANSAIPALPFWHSTHVAVYLFE